MIDGSVVDSGALSEYCQQHMGGGTLPINVEKYKIQGSNASSEPKTRLSAISQERALSESEYSDGELLEMTDKEDTNNDYEEIPDLPSPQTEQHLLNNLVDDDPLVRKLKAMGYSVDSSSAGSPPSLNDLSKDANRHPSKDSMYISTPNIKFKPGTMKDGSVRSSGSRRDNSQWSLPGTMRAGCSGDQMEKLKKSASSSGDENLVGDGREKEVRLDSPSADARTSSYC